MSGIFLNFIEYTTNHDKLKINYLPNPNTSIAELRKNYQDFNFYFCRGIHYYWSKKPGAPDILNGQPITINRSIDSKVYAKVVETSVINYLSSLRDKEGKPIYHTYKNEYFTWELTSPKNKFNKSIEGLAAYDKISFYPSYFKTNEKLLFGFAIAAQLKFRFLWKEMDFRSRGIDIRPLKLVREGIVIPNMEGIYHFLEATGKRDEYDRIISELESRKNTFGLINRISQWLDDKKSEIYITDGIQIASFQRKYLPFGGIKAEEIWKPRRYFYRDSFNTEKLYLSEQIKKYRPYSYGIFEDRIITIGVLYPSEYEGITDVFLKRLEKSLIENLYIKKVNYINIKLANTSLEAYKDGIYEHIEEIKKNIDLTIVLINEDHEQLPTNQSPYYVCKAKLLGYGVPTQDIQIETIQNTIRPLVLDNISLNIYAKLGGTAWTIQKEEKLKDELIIGVGSTINPDGKNILGIAQIFHPDGRYIVGNCSPLSSFENYAQNLEEYLYATLKEIIKDHINTDSRFRLIFHLYKPVGKDNEILAIQQVIKRLSEYEFDYAMLHLGYGHSYRLYWDGGEGKGKRGTYVKLDANTALLHFVADSCLPLKIELDKRSKGFNDLFYLAKQVFWFAHLSHRSYNPSKRTVTIMYPSLMASLTEKLGQVDHWDYDILKYVKDKLKYSQNLGPDVKL